MVKRLFIATAVAISPLYALAQGLITGHIKDARNGESLIGASVIVKTEKGQGVVTDVDGNFSLQTKKDAPLTLRVEYVGYRSQDVEIYDFDDPIEIALIDNPNKLDEVVIVGYGTQKRTQLTGSVTTVSQDVLNSNVLPTVDALLAGSVAGVQVTTSGQPGSGSSIRIRGGNSISANNDPLYVIDGFLYYKESGTLDTGERGTGISGGISPLSLINPQDIESIEVLKDVSATAILTLRSENASRLTMNKMNAYQNSDPYHYASLLCGTAVPNQF